MPKMPWTKTPVLARPQGDEPERTVALNESGEWERLDLFGLVQSTAMQRRLWRTNADMMTLLSAIWAAVRRRSQSVTRFDYKLMRRATDGTLLDAPETHPALLALRRVNGQLTYRQGRGLIEQQKLTAGQSVWVIRRNSLNVPVEFEIWPPSEVTPVKDKDKPWLAAYFKRHKSDGTTETVAARDVVWFRHVIDPRDSFSGLSPIGAVRVEADTTLEAQRFNQRFYDNDTHLGKLFTLEDASAAEVSRITRELERKFKGTDKAHSVYVTNNNLKLVETLISQKDMQFLEQQKWTVEEVARVFEMSPVLLGSQESSTYNNQETVGTDFWEMLETQETNTVDEWNEFFIHPNFGEEWILVLDSSRIQALQGNRLLQAQVDEINLRSAKVVVNELRERDGEEPVEWGDVPILPNTMAPLDVRSAAEKEAAQIEINKSKPAPVVPPGNGNGGGGGDNMPHDGGGDGGNAPSGDGEPRGSRGEDEYGRPYPNEHACRLRDPGTCQPNSFRRMSRKHNGKTYDVIMAKPKGSDTMVDQAFRYPKATWTEEEAKRHCRDHDGSFEAASSGRCLPCEQERANPKGSGPGDYGNPGIEAGWARRFRKELRAFLTHLDSRAGDQRADNSPGLDLGDVDDFDWDWDAKYGPEVVEELARQWLSALRAADFQEGLMPTMDFATNHAKQRAGELLNLSGEHSVTGETKDRLRYLVGDSLEKGESLRTLKNRLRQDYAFSPARATTIARTETAISIGEGKLMAFKSRGTKAKRWDPSGDSCSICLENEAAGAIPLDDSFPHGTMAPPAHPNCTCTILPERETDAKPTLPGSDDLAPITPGIHRGATKKLHDAFAAEEDTLSGDAMSEQQDVSAKKLVQQRLAARLNKSEAWRKKFAETDVSKDPEWAPHVKNYNDWQEARTKVAGFWKKHNIKSPVGLSKLSPELQKEERQLADDVFNKMHHYYTELDSFAKKKGVDPMLARGLLTGEANPVRGYVHEWANSSGDNRARSVAMQRAAAAEFKLKSHASPYGPDALHDSDDVLASEGVAMRDFLRAQYDETQAWFKERGITHVTLYRGVKVPKESWREGFGATDAELSALSSFTTDIGVAESFARGGPGGWIPGTKPTMIACDVPVDRILSTPFTGFGCLGEREVVVLGGPARVYAYGWAGKKKLTPTFLQDTFDEGATAWEEQYGS